MNRLPTSTSVASAIEGREADVGDEVADPRQRLLGPVDPGHDLLDALREGPFVLVEPADVLAGAGVLVLLVGPELDVAPHRHEVMQIIGQPVEPVAKAVLVQEIGLGIEKILDFLLEPEIGEVVGVAHVHSAASR
jgi:hypothetical protein